MICVEFDLQASQMCSQFSKHTFPINDNPKDYEGSVSSDAVADNEESELKLLNSQQEHVNELRDVN